MKLLRNLIVLFLVSGLIFLTFRYITYLKGSISNLEIQKQDLLQQLEIERSLVVKLQVKNAGLKTYLKATHRRLNKSFLDLEEAGLKNEQLRSQFSLLKAENTALLEEKAVFMQENENMKVKLSSVKELKKAIRELKLRGQPDGNFGFLIRNGQPTSVPKVKIEVTPVSDNRNERDIPSVSQE